MELFARIITHSDSFILQPDCILEQIAKFLLEERNQNRLQSVYGHLSLEGQRYGSELCFICFLSIKTQAHKREFCPMAHTQKQAEANILR